MSSTSAPVDPALAALGTWYPERVLNQSKHDGYRTWIVVGRQSATGPRIVRKTICVSPVYHEAYRREASLGQDFDHPNLVRTYGFCVDPVATDTIHMYMEYVDCVTLGEFLVSRPHLASSVVLHIATQLIAGLVYMHTHGVLHGDLKLANVLVDPVTTHVKLCDFGLSEKVNLHGFGSWDRVYCTPCFRPPETYMSQGQFYTCQSEVWAAGLILRSVLLRRFSAANIGVASTPVSPLCPAPYVCDRPVPHPSPRTSLLTRNALWTHLYSLSERMLCDVPARRPTMAEVYTTLLQLAGSRT